MDARIVETLGVAGIALSIAAFLVVLIVVWLAVWGIRLFNRLVRFRTLSEEGWSGILAGLKRRRDLVPNLVEVASGYMSHESDTFDKIARARAQGQAARGVEEMASAEASMRAALAGFRAVVENYPTLKADENMMHIQRELAELEERIEKLRRYYNATVRDYNVELSRFPANMVAGMMGFKRAAFFETDEQSMEAPEVKFPDRKDAAPVNSNSSNTNFPFPPPSNYN